MNQSMECLVHISRSSAKIFKLSIKTYPNLSMVDSLPLTWSHIMATMSYTGIIDSSLSKVSH
jgi:hypothetical protein